MRSSLRPVLRALLSVALALPLVSALSGCSMDKHVYHSTIHVPKTVSLRDTVTDETFWKLDIPVQHELVLDFDRSGEQELTRVRAELPADSLTWKLRTMDTRKTITSGKVKLPYPNPVSMEVTLRPAPELPGTTPIPGTNVPEPAPAPVTDTTAETPAPVEPAPEVTPEVSPEVTPEATPEVTPEPAAEATPEAAMEQPAAPAAETPAADQPAQQQASDDLLDALLKP